ncbi:tannase/feruloyl esterase family alpha/beta hydrolase [Mycolicibacterium parafortuitum]|uniref:tannase/feruloyl esterase family alpha/beta hydrolase n=1 Tax=Mycolicibacterium parafortuitum TaxID=39692 RepID=UPI0013D516A5|nr:tannase/feruloyl esterase family alpha/beta hydrolase [Mycolicibacterium parafortuitum]
MPSPADSIGYGPYPQEGQLWFGFPRGTDVSATAGPEPFSIAADFVAMALGDLSIGSPTLVNASGGGTDGWRNLTYQQMTQALENGEAMQEQLAHINTDNPDLSAFRNRGGKMLMYHGLADQAIVPGGSIIYYQRVLDTMGGPAAVQEFFRFYLVPGMGHAFANGTANPDAQPPIPDHARLYQSLTDWVENGVAPGHYEAPSPDSALPEVPLCLYPARYTTTGSGTGIDIGCA